MLSCLWDGADKRTVAANKTVIYVVTVAGFLSP